jgi:hypothetical protein
VTSKSEKPNPDVSKTNYLVDYGIMSESSSHSSLSAQLLLSIQPSLETIKINQPSKYVDFIWNKAEKDDRLTRDVRGKFFELLIASCLIKNGILPFFWQAQLEFVPLANFDLVVYTEERGPIVLSLKTSIRERYKQAEFEAQAMKYVHRRASNFLVTIERNEAVSLKAKIDSGVLNGIDSVVVANEKSFDELMELLKSLSIVDTPVFSAIKNPQKIEFRQQK